MAAAVGAAQTGASVALIERAPYLGGAATHSNVLTYCGIWTQADPAAQIVRGVGGAVLEEIDALGGDASPVRTPSNVVIALLDPEIVKFALDRICERADVDVLLHTTIIGASSAIDGVAWLDAFDHSGKRTIAAGAFVDASGEGDLAAFAGAAVRYGGIDGAAQNGTLVVRFGGIAAGADTSRGAWEHAVHAAKARGADALTKEHGLVIRIPGSNDVLAYLADEDYDVRDVRTHARAERHGRRQAWQLLDAIKTLPGHEKRLHRHDGPRDRTRESRHIVAKQPLTEAQVVGGATFPR